MDKKDKKLTQSAHGHNEKAKTDNGKKYNFYRKPSIKKKGPEVKQTLTSYNRMLKANPLLKYEMEGKELPFLDKQIQSTSNSRNTLEKQSSQPNFNTGKPLTTNLQRSKSLKNPSAFQSRPLVKKPSTIIFGNRPITSTNNVNSLDLSRQSSIDFNASTSKFLCSTKVEPSRIQKKVAPLKPSTKPKTTNKVIPVTQSSSISSSTSQKTNTESRTRKPLRRSLSAQHLDMKKGIAKFEPQKCFNHNELTQSLDDVFTLKPVPLHDFHDISPIQESREISERQSEALPSSKGSEIVFKTPSAYERRSIIQFTPRSTLVNRRSIYCPTTPLPSLNDLQKRLNDWLSKRGKSLSSFHHLKSFGGQSENKNEHIDEENKENVEVDQVMDKGSYEDLKIEDTKCNDEKSVVLNEGNAERIARMALDDLLKLIQEGYPNAQCEGWLELIRQKYRKLEEEPQYWECRAAIEQSRGNISDAVQCYRTAIIQGAEIQAVDESLDILLQKFSLLNISTDNVESEKSTRERARIVRDARNIFKSSIIQFAVQERKLKKNNNNKDEQKKLVATPVRRSTRLSRSAYTSTPGIKICSSLNELDCSDRDVVDFKKNKALF